MTLFDSTDAAPPSDWWAREANHRIANNLMLVSAMVKLQARAVQAAPMLSGAEVADFLGKVSARLDGVSQLHRTLSAVGPRANCAKHLEEICRLTLASAQSGATHALDLRLDPFCAPPIDQYGPLGLFLTEALVNAVKHAHAGGAALVQVVFSRDGDDFVLEVADDGPGLPANFDAENGGGLGFGIMRILAQQLQGRLEVGSSALGLAIRLRFPAPSPQF